MITVMLKIFEPKTFPTESAAPPDKAAIKATVNSGNEVEKAIKLNPTAVFPIRVIVANLTALLMARLDAQFSTRKETAMTKMLKMTPVSSISAMLTFPKFYPFTYPSIKGESISC
jgi:hypothetical protein